MAGVIIKLDGADFNDLAAPKVVQAIESTVESSLAFIKDRWQQQAQQKLHSTLPLYLLGLDINSILYPLEGNPFAGAVELRGKFPVMLEKGFSQFDMKIGFSNSKHKIAKKDGGWYLTIPMRHSTPGSYMYGNTMSKDMYGVAKKLPDKGKLTIKGSGDKSWTGYQHKSNKYDGLTRIIKSYNKAKQSQYFTFRRVSDKSDPLSWKHPGYMGVKIAESLEPYAKNVFTSLLKKNLSNLS